MLYHPGDGPTCVVVPVDKRQALLQVVHTSLGHNVHGMYQELRRAFYWRSMRADATDYTTHVSSERRSKTAFDTNTG